MTALDSKGQFPRFTSKRIQSAVQFNVPRLPRKASVGKRLPENQIVKRAHATVGPEQILDARIVRLFQTCFCTEQPCPPMLLIVAFKSSRQLIENLHQFCGLWPHNNQQGSGQGTAPFVIILTKGLLTLSSPSGTGARELTRFIGGTIIMVQRQSPPRLAKLKLDKRFQPCPVEPGDEHYPNGIFEFNITRLLAFIQEHADRFPVERVELSEIPDYGESPDLNEETIRSADLSRPILLAEIAPERYGVIDGNHRLAKARRQGATALPAYRLHCPAHVPFLTSTFAYERYVDYWNDKVKTLLGDLRGKSQPSQT